MLMWTILLQNKFLETYYETYECFSSHGLSSHTLGYVPPGPKTTRKLRNAWLFFFKKKLGSLGQNYSRQEAVNLQLRVQHL